MQNKDYMKKLYKKFSEFIEIAAVREIQYFVLDSKYSEEFNKKMKMIFKELKNEKGGDAVVNVMFDTNGEIALIDSAVLGKYISDYYTLSIQQYYGKIQLNKIIRNIINGTEKSKCDFIIISYKVLYNVLGSLYREIKCRKDLLDKYRNNFSIQNYDEDDISIRIIALLIVEDVSMYLGLDKRYIMSCAKNR